MLIVEDGSIVLGAESYCSTAFATAYHAARGNGAWAALASDEVREQLLRRATEYLTSKYRPRWKGLRTSSAQALDWPRYNVELEDVGYGCATAYVPSDVVPLEVQNACAALALMAKDSDLAPNIGRLVKQKTIGPLTTIYESGAPAYVQYRAVDMMLASFLVSRGRMVRA